MTLQKQFEREFWEKINTSFGSYNSPSREMAEYIYRMGCAVLDNCIKQPEEMRGN